MFWKLLQNSFFNNTKNMVLENNYGGVFLFSQPTHYIIVTVNSKYTCTISNEENETYANATTIFAYISSKILS